MPHALIQQSYRYELAPTEGQAKLLGSFTGASRFWFNYGLTLVKERLDLRATGDETVDVPWSYKAPGISTYPLSQTMIGDTEY